MIQAVGVFCDLYKWGIGMNGLALFAGVSGLELGIKRLFPQSRIICYVEGEGYAASVLVSKMEKRILHEAPIWSNVETFDGSIFSGKVDFISAGFPCQPWSKAGKLKKTEDKRWLWNDIERIICETTPSFIFLENVSNLINGGIDPVLASLAQMGFNAEWGCLKVSEIGGNHHRDRLFIFAYNPKAWGHFSDSYSDGFHSRRDFNENSCERISSEGRMAGYQSSGMREIISKFNQKWWEVEPKLGRMADGVSDRVDRLRACGNGVVPYQAYRAYSELIKRADQSMKKGVN